MAQQSHVHSSVKLVQVCKVAPNPTSPESPIPSYQSLPLTFFDIRWLRFAPVQLLYFYETSSSFDSLVEKLKNSLSLTLHHFLPLAGNVTWPQDSLKPILTYVQGNAVSLNIVESDADDFDHLSRNYDLIETQKYHPLVSQLEVSHEQAAVIALQITLFANKGFSIGATVHHAVFDGKTFISFLQSWAHICKHEGKTPASLPDHLKPFYDRTVIADPAELGVLFSNQYQNMEGPNNRSLMFWNIEAPKDSFRCTFEFTRATIHILKQHVMTRMAEKKQDHGPDSYSPVHLSTFSLACAYTWICLLKAKEMKADESRLIFSADCRSRLNPPIPATYFGNCVVGYVAVAETKRLVGEDGLVVAVSAITQALKSSIKNGVLNGAENWVSRLTTVRTDRLFSVAGSHRFGDYETDFGWGRPKKFELVSIDRRTGAISFADAKNGGGSIEVGLVLRKHHMDAFASLFSKGLGENRSLISCL